MIRLLSADPRSNIQIAEDAGNVQAAVALYSVDGGRKLDPRTKWEIPRPNRLSYLAPRRAIYVTSWPVRDFGLRENSILTAIRMANCTIAVSRPVQIANPVKRKIIVSILSISWQEVHKERQVKHTIPRCHCLFVIKCKEHSQWWHQQPDWHRIIPK
jgi:hypothetical protein